MTPAVKSPLKDLQEAVANLQQPGRSVTFEADGEDPVTLEDPREVCLRIAAEITDGELEEGPEVDPWPQDRDGNHVEYVPARLAAAIGLRLIRGINRLGHVLLYDVDYVYRRKDRWESKGRTVFGQLQRPTGLLHHYSQRNYVVLLNWQAWTAFSPWQQVALVYHELRHSEIDGKTRGHDFEGFFDEIELFGTGTYREWHRLAEAAGSGARVEVQYHLPLLDRELEGER